VDEEVGPEGVNGLARKPVQPEEGMKAVAGFRRDLRRFGGSGDAVDKVNFALARDRGCPSNIG